MDVLLLLGYVVAVIVLIATPGPNLFLMITHSLNYGPKAIVRNAAGGVSAALILIALALFGVAQFIPQSFLPYLSLIGGSYLISLGVKNWRLSKRVMPHDQATEANVVEPQFFKEAFLTGLSNPKDLLFFILFLPQFVDPALALWQAALLLMACWLVCDFGIMYLAGVMAGKLRRYLTGYRQIMVVRVLSTIMILLGVLLLLKTMISLVSE